MPGDTIRQPGDTIAKPAAETRADLNDKQGVWLHAVCRDLPEVEVAGLRGVGGGPVHTVEAAGLVAVVTSVDLDEFGEEPLRRNLEDLAWLETVARDHHRVVGAVARAAAVVPARLATVYHDDSRVGSALQRQRDEFVTALRRVAGRTEWGVKAYATADLPEHAGFSSVGSRTASGSRPGTAYLRRRSAQLSARDTAHQAAATSAEEVHAALCERAEAARRHAPQARKLTGEPGWMVLNGSYLVPEPQAAAFAELVRGMADRHPEVRLTLTGPWPPYSFAVLNDEGAPQ